MYDYSNKRENLQIAETDSGRNSSGFVGNCASPALLVYSEAIACVR